MFYHKKSLITYPTALLSALCSTALIFMVGVASILFNPSGVKAQTTAEPQPANNKKEFEQGYAWRIKQVNLNGQYIPSDLNDAFKELDKLTDAASRRRFGALTENDAQHKVFFSLGRWMVVNWAFYEGSRFSVYLREGGLKHPDDMTSFMLIEYHRYLNKKPLATKELIADLADKRKQLNDASNKKAITKN